MNTLFEDLQWRGLVFQCTDEVGLEKALSEGPIILYAGFDPTAESLHVGNLIPLLTLMRFQAHGHRALALVGGSTGQIGDPSGKSAERTLNDDSVVARRTVLIADQLSDFIGSNDLLGRVVNNLDWTKSVGVLEFLRDIGKHFSVNEMMARDSVKSRLARDQEGISFTEFAYMLLQSFDFLKLAENENCTLQIGGSDQWGNMCSGVSLVHRKLGREAFAMTLPLLTTFDGKKFGKSEKGAIWLDPGMTSTWSFMQFWKNVDDNDVIKLLKMFTFLSQDEIAALEMSLQNEPHLRMAQKALAQEMTDLVHGKHVRVKLETAAEALFGKGDVRNIDEATLELIARSQGGPQVSKDDNPTVTQLLILAGLESSNTRAAKVVQQGGVSINQVKASVADQRVGSADLLHRRFVVLKKGKRDISIIEFV
jgi:tyrosyl-tRNA synthetase